MAPDELLVVGQSLVGAGSVVDVLRAVALAGSAYCGLRLAAYLVEDGVCVLAAGSGPIQPDVVARCVASADAVSTPEAIAVPVVVRDRLVAVLSACSTSPVPPHPAIDVLAEVAATGINRVEALSSLEHTNRALQDVAERHQAEAIEFETHFRALYDQANLMLAVVDPDGRLVDANPFAVALLGRGVEDHIGVAFWELPLWAHMPAHRERVKELYQRARNGEAIAGEIELELADRSVRSARFQVSPVRGPDDTLDAILVSAFDVTEQKQAEEALHRTNEALEQARREAERAATIKTNFLANMSHEIRTPLNAIIGTTTLLLDGLGNNGSSDQAEIIRSSAEHLLSVISDILDMSKLESEHVELDHEPFDLDPLLESSLDLVTGLADEKGIEVTSFVEPGTPSRLVGDAARLRQILVNLLSNAVKFTDEGGVELITRGYFIGPGRVDVVFELRDSGMGIAAEELDVLFEPFVQTQSGHLLGSAGTGLGLSISERLVRLMGGVITVQSTVGIGTTFTVSVPMDVDEQAELPPPEPADLSGTPVLIVDDNEINRRLLEVETKRWGMVPTTCASPLDALALVDGGRRFDLALLDLNMPEMNGEQLAEVLRERATMPLVLLSSSFVDARTELFSARLSKPIKRHQLRSAIENALGRLSTTAANEAADDVADVRQPLRILVAEDNAVNQKVARALLGRLGYHPEVVADGHEVVKAVEETAYDLVLLDLRMPGLGGVEATAEILARHAEDRPRIVAVTASATEDERRRCLAAGMDDFITKPVTLDALARVVEEAARRKAAKAAVAKPDQASRR